MVEKCLEIFQFNLRQKNESKQQRRNWSHLFPGRILSSDWILLVANPGEEAAPALLPFLPHLPPSVAAEVVEGKVRSGQMRGCEPLSVRAQSGPRIPEGKRGGASDEVTLSQNRGAVNIFIAQHLFQADLGHQKYIYDI